MRLHLKLRMNFLGISMAQILATLGKTPKGIAHSRSFLMKRLDIANQARGDFKETFNMGKFIDPDYKQKLPPILLLHWNEIQTFQKECHTVTLRVLTLFALALNVLSLFE